MQSNPFKVLKSRRFFNDNHQIDVFSLARSVTVLKPLLPDIALIVFLASKLSGFL